jgi:hypothetical protein
MYTVYRDEKDPTRKGSELLQAGRSGHYSTSAVPLQITSHHITQRGYQKRGERRGEEDKA